MQQAAKKIAELPDYVKKASLEVQTAYEFALTHPEALKTIPCYCGCSSWGHKSILECYVKPSSTDANIDFEEHGSYCGICLAIALDVKRMTEAGKSPEEIRAYIVSMYSSYDPNLGTAQPAN
ncbi:MAG: hypothetical protein KF726_11770 [Anaerolineae bacterium]|nr:hypothetical protein [Anaerolineae bacterium]